VGLTLYSRRTLVSPEVRYLVEDHVPSIKMGVRLPSGAAFDFYGLHPKPPLMRSSAKGDTEVLRASREIQASKYPAVLAGDLNDVPWGYTNQRFLEVSGMVDPRVGRAFEATFEAGTPFFRWPIDHVYVTPDFGVLAFERLRDVGSDHFPLLADLRLGPALAPRVSGREISDAPSLAATPSAESKASLSFRMRGSDVGGDRPRTIA
jgi:endonuclease/exonuclease/phosphatase (EEP) superfamily protein YafD